MKIDVNPIIEYAVKTDTICLNMRGENCFYLVRLANGREYSVKWTEKEIETFQPRKTVTEVLTSWKENILRRYNEACEALNSGLHPTFTINELDFLKRPTGKQLPKPLDKYEIAHFEREKIEREKEFGDLIFVKIII